MSLEFGYAKAFASDAVAPHTMIELDILYQDTDLLVINKPSNLLCVPGLSSPDNLFDIARAEFPNIRTVHRLDMATSGVIIYALNHSAQRHIGKQFEARQVKKQYAAIVHGNIHPGCGEVALPLICDWPNRPRQKVDWERGKKAHTYFEVLKAVKNATHLRLFPITGRSHQLRVHCQSMGHPILGDQLYAPRSAAQRLMLHAEYIEFTHPQTQQIMALQCPAPFLPLVD